MRMTVQLEHNAKGKEWLGVRGGGCWGPARGRVPGGSGVFCSVGWVRSVGGLRRPCAGAAAGRRCRGAARRSATPAQRIRELVEQETEEDAKLAEQDWERITRQYGTQSFSARPAVDLRPVSSGLEVQVRYITRGPRRYEVKSRLFRQIVDVLHAPNP